MSGDIPAEFLPALPSGRNRNSVNVRDARVEAMMAHMQQRPVSGRRESIDSQGGSQGGSSRPRGPSVDTSRVQSVDRSRGISVDRPLSVRSNASEARPRLELAAPVLAIPERPMSMRSTTSRGPAGSFDEQPTAMATLERPMSIRSNAGSENGSVRSSMARSALVSPEELPIAMAQIEHPRTSKEMAALPPFARTFQNTAGNRQTLTLSDEELAIRLHNQLNSMIHEDGQIVTAEIVQQEVMDRRAAEDALDAEIAALENSVLARQLEAPNSGNDAGQAEDDAFRAAFAQNDKLDYMRPVSHKPIFSAIVLAVTTIAMCTEVAINGGVEPFQTNPTFGPKSDVLLQMGAKKSDLILQGEWWRLILPIILHAGFLHLAFNMLGLWNIGVPMEREFGTLKIGAIYVSSGLFGVLMSCLFAPKLVSVGASGAIFGLFGAAWADLIQNWSLYKGAQIRMLIQLLVMTIFNVVLGLMPFLDNYAHLGGLICGCILGLGVLVQTRYYYSGVKKGKRCYQIILMIVSVIALPAIFITGYLVLFLRVPIDCEVCSYISCVPMPPNVPYAERWWNCDECSQGGLTGDLQLSGGNQTLIFTCPNNGEQKQKDFASTVTVDSNLLIQTCIDMCL